jgi:hypothetical protein
MQHDTTLQRMAANLLLPIKLENPHSDTFLDTVSQSPIPHKYIIPPQFYHYTVCPAENYHVILEFKDQPATITLLPITEKWWNACVP